MQAINDVSLTIEPGETLGLVGESGSGKTTVGRCIVGLLEPSAGTIRFKGDIDSPQTAASQAAACRARSSSSSRSRPNRSIRA